MLAHAGIVVPELLDQTGHIAWFDAGATIFSPKGIQYLGIPGLINAKSIIATLIVQARASTRSIAVEHHTQHMHDAVL